MTAWWQRLRQKPYYRVSTAVVGLLLAVGIIFGWQHHNIERLNDDPVSGTRTELQKLAEAASGLHANLSANNPARATKAYLSYMNDIEGSCGRIATYHTRWQNSGAHTEADLFNQSDALCADLSKLAAFSGNLYGAVQPVMDITTAPHSYQTFWPFAGPKRRGDIRAVTKSLTATHHYLASRPAQDVDFSSDAESGLEQLQRTALQSNGPGYLPAVHRFQLQMLGERQRFWVQYAGLDSLRQELQDLTAN